jgi:RNA polymerase sigma factor (TIGR02999 family)
MGRLKQNTYGAATIPSSQPWEKSTVSDVSRILSQIEAGDPAAAEQLFPLVYDELRRLAATKLAREKPGQTLQATALVHEAWLKLTGAGLQKNFSNQQHFFSIAAEAMRQILVDRARKKLTIRHGGDWKRIPEPPELSAKTNDPGQTMAVHELLDRFGVKHVRQAEVAKMHLFLQMTFAEISEVMGLSADTIESDWAFARAWLKREWHIE